MTGGTNRTRTFEYAAGMATFAGHARVRAVQRKAGAEMIEGFLRPDVHC